jgi:flagellar basal body-associated protein FliL
MNVHGYNMHAAGAGAKRAAIIWVLIAATIVLTGIVGCTYFSFEACIRLLRNDWQGKHVKTEQEYQQFHGTKIGHFKKPTAANC